MSGSAAIRASVPWAQDERLARAAWSRLVEPEDHVAGWVLHALGPLEAVRHVLTGSPIPVGVAEEQVTRPTTARRKLDEGLERWRVRLARVAPERDVEVVERLGGRLVVPGEDEWPDGLDDLGTAAPPCLWVLGSSSLAETVRRSVAIVGARACTAYGERVAADLASGVSDRGVTVVSGGAFGVDAAAHRATVATGGITVVVLACGVDRDYPKAHDQLFARIRETGVAVSEVPPGSTVTRYRFLQRNRLIAAMTRGTVVVEAAWRSGALSTATHAAELSRPLGAVPGPVTSSLSAGCHRLIRDVGAVCITDAGELLELVLGIGEVDATKDGVPELAHDGLGDEDLRVYESLPLRTGRPVASICQVAGLPDRRVRSVLGRLAMLGLAQSGVSRDGERVWWRPAHPGSSAQGVLPM